MDRKKLVDYLNQYTSQGYDLESLKQHLIRNGIAEREIDDAIASINGNETAKEEIEADKIPIEIKILAGLYFMFGAMLLIYGMLVFISPGALPQSENLNDLIGNPSYFAFFIIAIGLVSLFVGYGVLKVRPWAKMEGMLISIIAAFTVIGIIITITTFYLFSRKEIKEAFGHSIHMKKEAKEIKKENLQNR